MSNKLFGNFFKENKKIQEFLTQDPAEAFSIALGYHLCGNKSIIISSKSLVLNSLASLNDMKIKEIPVPIMIGEKFNLFAEPITFKIIRRVLRGINIPCFIIEKESQLKTIGDLIAFAETMKCPVVFCVNNDLWRK